MPGCLQYNKATGRTRAIVVLDVGNPTGVEADTGTSRFRSPIRVFKSGGDTQTCGGAIMNFARIALITALRTTVAFIVRYLLRGGK